MFNPGYIFKSNMDHDYEVKKPIGKGAYGFVYLVQRKLSGTDDNLNE
jgi:hypothetical protein